MLNVKCEEHLETVKKFAEETGVLEQFNNTLEYLSTYGTNTECELFYDFAPHSFYFVMYHKEKGITLKNFECSHCKWTEQSEIKPDVCPQCGGNSVRIIGCTHKIEPKKFWFNGGMIFHINKWSVHT